VGNFSADEKREDPAPAWPEHERRVEPDAAVTDAGTDGAGTGAAPTDAAPDLDPRVIALQQTQQAINRALDAAQQRITACVTLPPGQKLSARVSVRVHRSGHVLEANVSNVPDRVAPCIRNVIQALKVSGMQTDSLTVQRTFNFSAAAPKPR
jgi:hypothetical protein